MRSVEKTHRLGLLTPSSNTTQEPELSAALPPTISLHTGRITYRDITSGNNGASALTGFDLVTGRGSWVG